MDKYVIGIDFGSTQSSVSFLRIGSMDSPELIMFGDSEMVPTELAVKENDDGEFVVAAWGNNICENNLPEGAKVVGNFKRYLCYSEGLSADEPDYDLKKNANAYSLLFLRELAKYVEGKKGMLSSERFVTCVAHPAGWDSKRVDCLKRLVQEAGFPGDERGIRTIEEPVAAVHSLRISDQSDFVFGNKPEKNMVIDFGGGTLDICIVETDICGREPIIPDNGRGGDPVLGGKDFDAELRRRLFNNGKADKCDYDSNVFYRRTVDKCCKQNKEQASRAFSSGEEIFRLNLESLTCGVLPLHKSELLTEEKGRYEGDFATLAGKFERCVAETLERAGVVPADIRNIILTGGSSLLFFVRDLLSRKFSYSKKHIHGTKNPYTDVVRGAAVAIGRTDEPGKIKGIWYEWCYNPHGNNYESWKWQGPICLKKPSKTESNESEFMKELDFSGIKTSYLFSHSIAVRFFKGYGEGSFDSKELPTVVEFYARKNSVFMKSIKYKASLVKELFFGGTSKERPEDSYKAFVAYETKTQKACLRIYNMKGALIESIELIPNRITYASKIGLGVRKEEILVSKK